MDHQNPILTASWRKKAAFLWQSTRQALGAAWQYSRPQLLAMVALSLFLSTLPALQALVARELINLIVANIGAAAPDYQGLALWLGLGLLLTFIESGATVGFQYASRRFGDVLQLRLNLDIIHKAAAFDLANYSNPQFRNLLERVRANIAFYIAHFISEVLQILSKTIEMAGIVIILLAIDPLAILIMFPLVIPYMLFYWRRGEAKFKQDYNMTTKMRWTGYLLHILTSAEYVAQTKFLRLSPYLIGRYQAIQEEFTNLNRKLYRRQYMGEGAFSFLFISTLYAAFAVIVWRVVQGSLTVGDVTIYLRAGTRLRDNLQVTSNSVAIALGDALYISDWQQFLQSQNRIMPNGALQSGIESGEIRFEGVSFAYPHTERLVLEDLNFTIPSGQVVALVGENGAGKSTLARLIARLYDPTAGRVLVDGQALDQYDLSYLYSRVGFVFQEVGHYEATAHENIAFGDWKNLLGTENRPKIQEIAKRAQIDDLIQAMPQAYETHLGLQFGSFNPSGGQWQRIAIARALAKSPAIVIMDEPSANIDVRAEYELFQRLRDLTQGRSTILISHRFSTVKLADRILVMDKGRIIEDGSHQDLLARNGHYAALYRLVEGAGQAQPDSHPLTNS
jgi:ATP-binding cassette subfamily B protein